MVAQFLTASFAEQPNLALGETDALARFFFQQSAGQWRSQRRYYTLQQGETQEVVSMLTIKYLEQGCEELRHLAGLHDATDENLLTSGVLSTWESAYLNSSKGGPNTGRTVFGVAGNLLYRDRGFSTLKPIVAEFEMRDLGRTMYLQTSYSGSSFTEDVKLVGSQYRTRQTIISRAGEEVMIGQYLETRLG